VNEIASPEQKRLVKSLCERAGKAIPKLRRAGWPLPFSEIVASIASQTGLRFGDRFNCDTKVVRSGGHFFPKNASLRFGAAEAGRVI